MTSSSASAPKTVPVDRCLWKSIGFPLPYFVFFETLATHFLMWRKTDYHRHQHSAVTMDDDIKTELWASFLVKSIWVWMWFLMWIWIWGCLNRRCIWFQLRYKTVISSFYYCAVCRTDSRDRFSRSRDLEQPLPCTCARAVAPQLWHIEIHCRVGAYMHAKFQRNRRSSYQDITIVT